MMRTITRFAAILALAFVTTAVTVVLPAPAEAQSRSSLDGPSVRRQLLFRSSRLEVAPAVGAAFGRLYQRELMLAVTGRYHLTNSFSVGLNANAGLLGMDTSIASNYEAADPLAARELQYATQLLLADLHLSYVPFSGKFNLIGNHIFHFDAYLAAGVGGALLTADSSAPDLGGFKFGPAISAGFRVFIKDNIALNLRLSDYLYSAADSQRVRRDPTTGLSVALEVDEEFGHHFVGMVGVSIFLPPEVRVSR